MDITNNYLIWSSFVFLILLFGVYLWFVLLAGPKFMEKREPYNVTELIRFYNCFQVIVCTYFLAGGIYLGFTPNFIFKCQKFDFLTDEVKLKLLVGTWLFLGLRILEFSETIFFVLRKKQGQASFLHIFHHIGSVLMTWLFIAMHAGK